MSQVNNQVDQINAVINSKGGVYSSYRCKKVSWDDVSRFGSGSSSVSCWGSNITDTRLYAKDNTLLYTLRPENWNEKLGNVSSDDISLIYDNKPITLTDYLKNFKINSNYATKNCKSVENLYAPITDKNVSVRFQTTFLPVENTTHGNLELAPEVYNYGSKNIQLLCTSQGVSVQRGTSGSQKLFHHETDPDGNIHRYWFEVERSNHKVGGAQTETKEEIEDALARGKSIATCIGTKAMGTRFNVLMTIQVPTKKEEFKTRGNCDAVFTSIQKQYGYNFGGSPNTFGGGGGMLSTDGAGNLSWNSGPTQPVYRSLNVSSAALGLESNEEEECCEEECDLAGGGMGFESDDENDEDYQEARDRSSPPRVSAARLSRGSEHDTWKGITGNVKRDTDHHVTVTIVLYNSVAGGVPDSSDVVAAIDDMENLYKACHWSGKLNEKPASFMKPKTSPVNVPFVPLSVPSYTPTPQQFHESLKSFPMSGSNSMYNITSKPNEVGTDW